MTTDLESRLRHAFEARTAGVPVPPEPDWEVAQARPRKAYPILGVIATVAATLVVLLTVTLVWGDGGSDDQAFRPGTVEVTPVWPAKSPTLALRRDTSNPQIVNVATGKVLGTALPPAGYDVAWAGYEAAAADNRTFFFTVSKALNSRHMVARVHVDDQGRPDGRAVLVAQVPTANELNAVAPPLPTPNTNEPARWATLDGLSVSPDATRLAMTVSTRNGEGLSVWDLSTGRNTTWGSPTAITALAWGGDGSLLWASGHSAGRLDPESRPSILRPTQSYSDLGDAEVSQLLPSGDRIVVLSEPYSVRLVQLSRHPGGPERVLDQWVATGGDNGGAVVDGSARHVLYLRNSEGVRLDLKTGARTPTKLGGPENKMAIFTW
ncbi:hypothetical protein [Actinomadura sp. 6N118]|uniref:hypothetical protein n=1 Tax=Actinomadura sp. 6N118 TaxID=3375151 RepID=UPI00379C5E2F